MTKKDYELIAQALKLAKPSRNIVPYNIETQGQAVQDVYCYGKDNAWDNTCKTLADVLSSKNTRFNRYKFLQACGISDD